MHRPAPLLSFLLLAGCQAEESLPPCGQPAADCPRPSTETFVDPLVHVGRAEGPTFVEPLDVAVDGALVHACTGTQGLMIWDAEGSGAPSLLAQRVGPTESGLANGAYPRCQHVVVDPEQRRMVITNRGDEIQPTPWIAVYDVSDPRSPRLDATWVPPDASPAPVEGVVIDRGRIHAAAHTSGLLVLDQTPDGLVQRGAYVDEDSDAWQPVRMGDALVVAEGATGLRTYDVSGDDPVLLATLPLPGSSRDLVVHEGTAYVAASSTLVVVDVADPAAPRVLGEVETPGTALAVARADDDIVMVAEWDEIRGYSVADPTRPALVLTELSPTDDERSRVLGIDADPIRGRVYAAEWRGLQAFQQQTGGRGPDVALTPQALQLGQISPGSPQSRVLVVRNQGDRTLTVTDVVGPAGVTADERCFAVEPGSAHALEILVDPPDADELRGRVKVCSDDPDEPEASVSISANIEGLDVGDPAPDFLLTDLDGGQWSTSQLQGNIVVLAYFATF